MDEPRRSLSDRPNRRPRQPAPEPVPEKSFGLVKGLFLGIGTLLVGVGIAYLLLTYTSFNFFGLIDENRVLAVDETVDLKDDPSFTTETEPVSYTGQKSRSKDYVDATYKNTIGVYDNSHTTYQYDWFVVTDGGDVYLVDGIEQTNKKLDASNPIIQSVLNSVVN